MEENASSTRDNKNLTSDDSFHSDDVINTAKSDSIMDSDCKHEHSNNESIDYACFCANGIEPEIKEFNLASSLYSKFICSETKNKEDLLLAKDSIEKALVIKDSDKYLMLKQCIEHELDKFD